MAAFEYIALNKTGNTRKGVLEGDTARQIRQQLRESDLVPLSINLVITAKRKQSKVVVNATDLALITRQLATLVRAGLALEEALRAISEQTDKAKLKSMLLVIRSRVLEGHSLADGLQDFPKVFPTVYRSTVTAGEQSGHLDLVLERLAEYTENRQYIRQKTLLALFYPALLSGVAILVVIGLLAYVVPQVVQVFDNINQQLPWLTLALIAVSDFLKNWGILVLFILVLIGIGVRYSLRFEKILLIFHLLLLKIPLISHLELGTQVARFTRTLSILTESGVPMLEALQITSQVMSNHLLRNAVEEATNKVREGSSLHNALEQSHLFPPMTVYLIASGEASGKLEQMLERAAIMQERELESLIGVILSLFEPILILVMGGMVLTIVLAILMPIFELNQLVR
ncbi:MAG: type II secretion system inner membrane protein GspF [Candidatus Marithrix sp.]|nr:type II secretion system inner membrane protein GspF [Candidatus Marithrix sp.]